ncbi:Ankyrin repeat family protein [Perilla frutescens var. frutescens]|nr:Ankyrin repeat family protein [Perilla frutescens var. frutescens]
MIEQFLSVYESISLTVEGMFYKELGIPQQDIEQEKWKPLHTFALAGQIKFMDELLEKGYNIEQVDKMSGSYASGTYGTQTNLWQGGQYATYGSHQYPNYSQQDTNSAYSSTTLHWYKLVALIIIILPLFNNTVNSGRIIIIKLKRSGNVGYTASNNQMPAAYAPQWRPGSSSSELTSVQVWLS